MAGRALIRGQGLGQTRPNLTRPREKRNSSPKTTTSDLFTPETEAPQSDGASCPGRQHRRWQRKNMAEPHEASPGALTGEPRRRSTMRWYRFSSLRIRERANGKLGKRGANNGVKAKLLTRLRMHTKQSEPADQRQVAEEDEKESRESTRVTRLASSGRPEWGRTNERQRRGRGRDWVRDATVRWMGCCRTRRQ